MYMGILSTVLSKLVVDWSMAVAVTREIFNDHCNCNSQKKGGRQRQAIVRMKVNFGKEVSERDADEESSGKCQTDANDPLRHSGLRRTKPKKDDTQGADD